MFFDTELPIDPLSPVFTRMLQGVTDDRCANGAFVLWSYICDSQVPLTQAILPCDSISSALFAHALFARYQHARGFETRSVLHLPGDRIVK